MTILNNPSTTVFCEIIANCRYSWTSLKVLVSFLTAYALAVTFYFESGIQGAFAGILAALIFSGFSSLFLRRKSPPPVLSESSSDEKIIKDQSVSTKSNKLDPVVLAAIIQGLASIIVALIAILK